MLVLAKVALGLGATLAMTTAYVFHEGVIRVDVDEHRPGGGTRALLGPGHDRVRWHEVGEPGATASAGASGGADEAASADVPRDGKGTPKISECGVS